MRRLAIIAPCALAVLVLAGCQSEDEKRAERDKLKSEIRTEIMNELSGVVGQEVRSQLSMAIEDHKRKLADQQAAAKAVVPVKPTPAPAVAPRRR